MPFFCDLKLPQLYPLTLLQRPHRLQPDAGVVEGAGFELGLLDDEKNSARLVAAGDIYPDGFWTLRTDRAVEQFSIENGPLQCDNFDRVTLNSSGATYEGCRPSSEGRFHLSVQTLDHAESEIIWTYDDCGPVRKEDGPLWNLQWWPALVKQVMLARRSLDLDMPTAARRSCIASIRKTLAAMSAQFPDIKPLREITLPDFVDLKSCKAALRDKLPTALQPLLENPEKIASQIITEQVAVSIQSVAAKIHRTKVRISAPSRLSNNGRAFLKDLLEFLPDFASTHRGGCTEKELDAAKTTNLESLLELSSYEQALSTYGALVKPLLETLKPFFKQFIRDDMELAGLFPV